jgi:hypothetical protein
MSFEKRIHSRNIFYKEIEMKWSKLRNIWIFLKSEPNPIEMLWGTAIKILQSCDVKFIEEIDQLIKIAGNL